MGLLPVVRDQCSWRTAGDAPGPGQRTSTSDPSPRPTSWADPQLCSKQFHHEHEVMHQRVLHLFGGEKASHDRSFREERQRDTLSREVPLRNTNVSVVRLSFTSHHTNAYNTHAHNDLDRDTWRDESHCDLERDCLLEDAKSRQECVCEETLS